MTLYVLSGNTVTPIATATNTPGQPIKVAPQPRAMAITPDGMTVYVASIGACQLHGDAEQCEPGTVTPISTATNAPGQPIPVGVMPLLMVIG